MLATTVGDGALITQVLLALVIVPSIYWILSSVTGFAQSQQTKFWKQASWAGVRNEWFAGLRAKFRTLSHMREIAEAGYEEFSKKDRAFAVPTIVSEPYLVIPPSLLNELLNKSDAEVSARDIHQEHVQVDYTQPRQGRLADVNDIHFSIVKRQLTRKLPLLTADVYDELRIGFDQYFGTDRDNLKTINVFPIALQLVTRAANRVFAGKELCRNDDFLEHSRMYSQRIFGDAGLIAMLPKWLRPVLAPVITFTNRKNEAVCKRIAIPLAEERLQHTQRKHVDESYEWEPPTDALQWIIDDAIATGDPKELDPDLIAFRLMMVNMVAIHTTSITISNVILDLYSSPNVDAFVAGLREECSRVLAKHGGVWSKDMLNELIRTDSTIRESMRISNMSWQGISRIVTAPNGIDLGTNIHIANGVRVCAPADAMHNDSSMYPRPTEFQAFRFSQPREDLTARLRKQKLEISNDAEVGARAQAGPKPTIYIKQNSLVTTSEDFLAFGHGRHACPGRFFAAQELKLFLAYMVMNYDVTPMKERPPNAGIIGMSFPTQTAQITVRRR